MKYINKLFNQIKFKVSLFLIRRIDDVIILLQKIRPSTHFARLRIKELHSSEMNYGDNVCIFIIYENMNIPKLTWDAINQIKKMGIKLFIVVNSKLSENEISKVREISDICMFRKNTGKDIGGYKDAFVFLKESGSLKKINRLIFANDSVVYPTKFIEKLFTQLIKSTSNFVGYSHSLETQYHIQSFLFSCDSQLVQNNTFVEFWQNYLPVDRRRYMIRRGEFGITNAVIKSGLSISSLNNISELINIEISLESMHEIVNSFPTALIKPNGIDSEFINLNDRLLDLNQGILGKIRTRAVADFFIDKLNADVDKFKRILYKEYLYDLINIVGRKNNTSWNTFIFLELNKPVIIKRDSIYRAGYDINIFSYYLRKYFEDDSDQIMLMMKLPSNKTSQGIGKLLFQAGVI